MNNYDKCPYCGQIAMPNWDAIATARACQNIECKKIEQRVIEVKK